MGAWFLSLSLSCLCGCCCRRIWSCFAWTQRKMNSPLFLVRLGYSPLLSSPLSISRCHNITSLCFSGLFHGISLSLTHTHTSALYTHTHTPSPHAHTPLTASLLPCAELWAKRAPHHGVTLNAPHTHTRLMAITPHTISFSLSLCIYSYQNSGDLLTSVCFFFFLFLSSCCRAKIHVGSSQIAGSCQAMMMASGSNNNKTKTWSRDPPSLSLSNTTIVVMWMQVQETVWMKWFMLLLQSNLRYWWWWCWQAHCHHSRYPSDLQNSLHKVRWKK